MHTHTHANYVKQDICQCKPTRANARRSHTPPPPEKENSGCRRSALRLLRPLLPSLAPRSGVMAHVVVGGTTWNKQCTAATPTEKHTGHTYLPLTHIHAFRFTSPLPLPYAHTTVTLFILKLRNILMQHSRSPTLPQTFVSLHISVPCISCS